MPFPSSQLHGDFPLSGRGPPHSLAFPELLSNSLFHCEAVLSIVFITNWSLNSLAHLPCHSNGSRMGPREGSLKWSNHNKDPNFFFHDLREEWMRKVKSLPGKVWCANMKPELGPPLHYHEGRHPEEEVNTGDTQSTKKCSKMELELCSNYTPTLSTPQTTLLCEPAKLLYFLAPLWSVKSILIE